MNVRKLLLSAGLLSTFCGTAFSQAPMPPVVVTELAPPVASTPPVVAPTPLKTVEELMNELERVQSQKAELEKKEQELKSALQKRLELQGERLEKLGVSPKPLKDAEPDRLRAIFIEGNTKTPESKILGKLQLHPGQILQYPKLEEARQRLEKAGFRGATIEVVPSELDSTFKDLKVKMNEPKPDRR